MAHNSGPSSALDLLRMATDRHAVLDSHCLSRIARFKRPREYIFADSLPKNANGKVLKLDLRDG